MLSKKLIIFIYFAAIPILLLFLFILARLLSWIQIYSIPTTNMEPKYKIGDIVFGTCLINPKKSNIIAYNAKPLFYEEIKKNYIALCRVVATENDKVQIKNGILYVNDKFNDDTLNLCYNFILNYDQIINHPFTKYDFKNKIFPITDSTYIVNFSYAELKKLNFTNQPNRIIDTSVFYLNNSIFKNMFPNLTWTNDNFGPVVVPKNYLFLLGDNRSNSADSRIRGFISKDDVLTTVIE